MKRAVHAGTLRWLVGLGLVSLLGASLGGCANEDAQPASAVSSASGEGGAEEAYGQAQGDLLLSKLTPVSLCGGLFGTKCPSGTVCVHRLGKCGAKFAIGVCVPQPVACPDVLAPVCGCDGVTYPNKCEALLAGVSIDHAGACENACTSDADCGPGQTCDFAGCAATEGKCVPAVAPKDCPRKWEPVCGCDGKTYPNDCVRRAAGAARDHAGLCKPKCKPVLCPAGKIAVDTNEDGCADACKQQCHADADCGPGGKCTQHTQCPPCVYATPACKAPCKLVSWCEESSCCKSDADCNAGDVCVKGVCRPQPKPGTCWSDADCAQGSTCEGAHVCPCGALCILPDQLGKCVPKCDPDETCWDGIDNNCNGQVDEGCTCTDDSQCPDGLVCETKTICPPCTYEPPYCDAPCLLVGKCVPPPPPGCCKTDADCGKGQECVGTVCKPVPKPGMCWSDADCGPGQDCIGASVCPCGAECLVADHPGLCTPACADAEVCWDGVDNNCDGQVDENCSCLSDADCPDGLVCQTETYCPPCTNETPPCEAPCWLKGKCVEPTPPGCCKTDADCAQGEECVGTVCKPIPPTGECWSDADCAAGETCVGAAVCPCGAECIIADHAGKCEPKCAATETCWDGIDNDCDGQIDEGCSCLTDADCPDGLVCQLEPYCPPCTFADPPCMLPCTMKGQCVPPPQPGCCKTDADCGKGQECVGTVCKPLPSAGECWSDADCGPDAKCEGASVCPCGALCIIADHPGKCVGVCGPDEICWDGLDNDCDGQVDEGCSCTDDSQCPDGLVCQTEPYCPPCTFADPPCMLPCTMKGKCVPPPPPGCCKTDADCATSSGTTGRCVNGKCVDPAPDGACWTDADCATGETCKGSFVCPCGALCGPIPDAPGKCVPTCADAEVCWDGIDNDCDGQVDEGCSCLSNDDCPKGLICEVTPECICDNPLCLAPCKLVGKCVPPPPPGCCTSNADCVDPTTGLGAKNICIDGACVPPAPPDTCWTDADCAAGETCDGANICPCGTLCKAPSTPGKCVAVQPLCCTADADCAAGEVCVAGVCSAAPKPGECWTDADCGGAQCIGATTCPCGAMCILPSHPGTCAVGCYGDQDCPKGMVCNAAQVCLSPPGCKPGAPCPTVCYGWCVSGGVLLP